MPAAPAPSKLLRLSRSVATAVAFVAAATLVCQLADRHVSLTSQAMVYLLAVVLSAFLPSRLDSALTALLGVSAMNYFFVPPRHTFAIASTDYEIALASFFAVSLVISGVAGRLRYHVEQADRREGRARQLYALGETLAGAGSEALLVEHGALAVSEAIGAPCGVWRKAGARAVELEARAPQGGGAPVDEDAVRWAIEHGESIGPTTRNWPDLPAWYVPLPGVDRAFAVGFATSRPSVTEEDRRHVETVASQVASALQRVELAGRARAAAVAAEAESVRNALLASISHDLRTPLAVIVGSASTLAEQWERLSEKERETLLRSIADEGTQMSAVAENVLQMARLSAGESGLRRDWESIEEVAGSVLARLRRRGAGSRVRARIAPGLPLVRIDGVMIAQVIVNLLENALRHSPEGAEVALDARGTADGIEVSVSDRGPGFDDGEIPKLFAKFHRGTSESPHTGVGLGLAICKAVIDAHGGTIEASNRAGGGAEVRFTLPAGERAPALEETE